MKSQSLTKAHAHFLGNYVIVVISLTIGPTSALRCTNLRLRTSPGARAPRALFLGQGTDFIYIPACAKCDYSRSSCRPARSRRSRAYD